MADNVSKRLFGANIHPKVRKILGDRQKLAKAPQPGDSLNTKNYENFQTYNTPTHVGVGGMSSKTTFVRMWTAIDPITKVLNPDKTFSLDANSDATITTIKDAQDLEDKKTIKDGIEEYEMIEYGKVYKMYRQKNKRQILTLGDHGYYTLLNQTNNEFLRPPAGITRLSSSTSGNLGLLKKTEVEFVVYNFKEYQDIYQRYFLKPGATLFVDFGWNMVQDSASEPGNFLYEQNIEELVGDGADPDTYFYGDGADNKGEEGWNDKTMGNVETIYGKVTSYDSNMNADGSFTCKVEIVSGNMSINGSVNKDVNKWVAEKLDDLVDVYLLNTGKKLPEGLAEEFTYTYKHAHQNSFLKGRWVDYATVLGFGTIGTGLLAAEAIGDIYSSYKSSSGEEEVPIDYDFLNLMFNTLSLRGGQYTPMDDSIKWGIFSREDENWIQIHSLEDLVFNALYAFSEKLSGVKETESSEEAFDSSWQATFWPKESMMHQWECGSYECDPDGFPLLYPYTRIHRQWKHKPDKYPTIDDAIKDGQTFYLNTEHGGKPDLLNMPIGQLFVNMKLVVEAFNDTDPGKAGSLNVLEVYQKLVAKINEETGYTDFRLIKNPKVDGQWTLVDLNYLGQQDYLGKDWQDIKDEAQPDKKKSFKDLFEFDVTSQSSITSDVKLGFKMPSDNLANMIAISGNSGGRGYSALDRLEDEAICTEIVHSLLEGDVIDNSSKVVDHFTRYLPEQKSDDMFLAKQKAIKNNFQSELQDVFAVSVDDVMKKRNIEKRRISNESIEALLKEEYEKEGELSSTADGDFITDIKITYVKPKPIEEDARTVPYTKQQRIERGLIQTYMEKEGSSVSYDIHSYYKKQLKNKIYNQYVPTILPMTLSMTIDGIAGLDFGNIFQINYLPKTFKNKVFFQITKVSHDVTSNGWKTTLDTQFRFNNEIKENENTSKIQSYLNHYLHIEFLRKQITHGPSLREIPFYNLLKLKPTAQFYSIFSEELMINPNNQIMNMNGVYTWEGRFDVDGSTNTFGFRMKSEDEPDVPDTIYDTIPEDTLTPDEIDKTNESYMFLLGSLFTKNAILYSETHASADYELQSTTIGGMDIETQKNYLKWHLDNSIWDHGGPADKKAYMTFDELKTALTPYKNFVIEPVDQTSTKRFLIASQLGDDNSVNVYQGAVANDALDGPGTGKNDLYDSEMVAFYPSIPHNKRQLCVQWQGRMCWVPYDQFINDSNKEKVFLALHIFLMNEVNKPLQVYDIEAAAFLSRTGGYAPSSEVKLGQFYTSEEELKARYEEGRITTIVRTAGEGGPSRLD
tara:strand:- start:908 stop:4810 length:3903 start_codon:yes stop_codon:yes gene_type:complete